MNQLRSKTDIREACARCPYGNFFSARNLRHYKRIMRGVYVGASRTWFIVAAREAYDARDTYGLHYRLYAVDSNGSPWCVNLYRNLADARMNARRLAREDRAAVVPRP